VREVNRRGLTPVPVEDTAEHPGLGLTGSYRGEALRLGNRGWCGMEDAADDKGLLEFAFRRGGKPPVVFQFQDKLRSDAAETIAALKARGLDVHLLSGDREAAVRLVANALHIDNVVAHAAPKAKLAYVEALTKTGRKVLMVGDGINDAPALAAGFTSMAPSTASDIGRTAAETVFMTESVEAVATAIAISSKAQRVARQNFMLAIGYNVLAVPLAMVGLVSPLVAAIAMSTSSIIVIANALRLGLGATAKPSTASLGTAQSGATETMRDAA
jgi:Cu2+-exporting ATPase